MNNLKKYFTCLLSLFLITGCASLKVEKMNPYPNLNIASSDKILGLELSPNIQNNFEIPAKGGIKSASVAGWRDSLQNGFNNGFSDVYKLGSSASDSDLILKLTRADIEFAPSAVRADGTPVAIHVQILYKASLVDNTTGETVKRAADTVVSKRSITRAGDTTEAVKSAVETMYEIIAAQFF